MARGGKRANAGRRIGAKVKLEKEIANRLEARDPIGKGQSPLQIMVSMMRDKKQEPAIRLAAAKGAAEYVHRKMPTAVEHSGAVKIEAVKVTFG